MCVCVYMYIHRDTHTQTYNSVKENWEIRSKEWTGELQKANCSTR